MTRDSQVINESCSAESDVTPRGTYTFRCQFDVATTTYPGTIELEFDGNLAARIEWVDSELTCR